MEVEEDGRWLQVCAREDESLIPQAPARSPKCRLAVGLAGLAGALAVVALFSRHGLLRASRRNPLAPVELYEDKGCSCFECPAGSRRRDGFGSGLSDCCEEARCTCSSPGNSSNFTCDQEVPVAGCGQDYVCSSADSWLFYTDFYGVACKRTKLLGPSNAPVHTFYVYRSSPMAETFVGGFNVANDVGVMMHIHMENARSHRPFLPGELDGGWYIRRFKVKVRATTLLQAQGMTFGPRYNVASGRCSGLFPISNPTVYPAFERLGRAPGCRNMATHPVMDPWLQEEYPGIWTGSYFHLDSPPIWYSFPGPCSDRPYTERDSECEKKDPGGLCTGTPTGAEDCSYSIEPAGNITFGELAGIQDYDVFYANGGVDYNWREDTGVDTCFWDHRADSAACQKRVDRLRHVFAKKFGVDKDVEEAFCDYRYNPQDYCSEARQVGIRGFYEPLWQDLGC